jgi:tetratricopeptide (TPR) repeat protein
MTSSSASGPSSADTFASCLASARDLIQNAHFDDAAARLEAMLEQFPLPAEQVETLYALAVAHRYNKDVASAIASLDRLLVLRPDYSRAYQERGYNLLAVNEPGQATNAFARAVEINPGLLASWKALAQLHARAGRRDIADNAAAQVRYLESLPRELAAATDLMYDGRLAEADQLCRQFLRGNRQHVEGMRILADIGVRLRVYDDAEFLLESCVSFDPENLRARADYLGLLNRRGKFAKAREQAEVLLAREPEDPGARAGLAAALVGLGRVEAGIVEYQRVIEQGQVRPGIYLLLGHAQKAAGDLDAAVASYQHAYQIRPAFGDAYWSLANTKTYRFTDAEIERIQAEETATGIGVDDRVHLCFAAGKAFEDRKDYDRAFEYYERGNSLQQTVTGFDPARTTRIMQRQREVCSRELFERRGHLGYECRDPIFIVGLPRAGSTLLEQIIASHSMVDGTMELHNILGLAQRLRGRAAGGESRYPQILWELEDDYFRRFGEQFINDTRVYRGGAPMFIDKMPNNFIHIGLIRLILPGAKVIDARRHPMGCCFSGFKQLFGEGQDFTYGLESIGRYYRDYVELMDHWDRVLPGFVLRVMYEDVVADLDGQVRRILDFLGLPFEEGCLRFHETERSVKTPSSEQVRQPIYRGGLEQWRHFDKHLGPLRDALGPEILRRYPAD